MAGLVVPTYNKNRTDLIGRSQQAMGGASNSYASMMKEQPQPEKTAGGALASGAAMGMAGMQVGGMLSAEGALLAGSAMAGPVGLGVGAAVGMAAYLLS